uniref:Sentrin-specific protease 1 n=1 Tax=Hydra vulgaris TaxID=6087 RepID=T2M4M7_HYDVU
MLAAVKNQFQSFFTSGSNTKTQAKCTSNKRKRSHSNMNQTVSPPDKRKKSTDDNDENNIVPTSKWILSNLWKYVTGVHPVDHQNQSAKNFSEILKVNEKYTDLLSPQCTQRGTFSQISNKSTLVFDLTYDNDVIETIENEDIFDLSKVSINISDIQYPNDQPLGSLCRKENNENFIRLEEKRRYKEILEKFTSVYTFSNRDVHQEVVNISEINEFDYSNKNLKFEKIDLTLKNVCKQNRNDFKKIIPKSVTSPISSITSPFPMCSTSKNEEILNITIEDDALKTNQSSLLDLCWIKKWRENLDPITLERERQIKEEERKVARIKQNKDEKFEKFLKNLDAKNENEFPNLTNDMLKIIKRVLSHGPPNEVITCGFDANITRADLSTLRDSCWLNDEVINFYFNLIRERSEKKSNIPKIHIFNTFFYPKLVKTGFAGIKRWTRKTDIFSYDMILIPIHLGMHWCLAEINFTNKQLVYYDSLKGNNMSCIIALKDYLLQESKDKKNECFNFTGWQELMPKDIPEQMNGCDCGVFACKYAEYRSRNAKFTFSQENMPYFRQRMIYEITSKKLL